MKFMISSEAVEKALQTVSSVFSGSDLEKKKVAIFNNQYVYSTRKDAGKL